MTTLTHAAVVLAFHKPLIVADVPGVGTGTGQVLIHIVAGGVPTNLHAAGSD